MSFFVPSYEPCGCKIEREITAYCDGWLRARYTHCSWCQVRYKIADAWKAYGEALHIVELQRECGWTIPEDVQP